MLAEKNKYLQETAEHIFNANADEIVRQQCRAREEAERRERTLEHYNEMLEEKIAALEDKNSALEKENSALLTQIKHLQKQLSNN